MKCQYDAARVAGTATPAGDGATFEQVTCDPYGRLVIGAVAAGADIATETTLTALSGKLPAALGPATPAGSLSVVAAQGTLYTWQVPCTTAGRALLTAWAQSTTYAVGEAIIGADGKIYKCRTAGASAGSGTGPSGTDADITDNAAHWAYYIAAAPVFKGSFILRNKTGSASAIYYDTAAITAPGGAEIPSGQGEAVFTTGNPASIFVAAVSTATATVAGYA